MATAFQYQNQQNYYIEAIEKGSESIIVTQRPIVHQLTTLPYINMDKVIGRADDLQGVIDLLEQSQKVVLVNGLGGIGKTTLAKALLQQQQTTYQHIAWVNVVADLKEAFVFNAPLIANLFIDLETIPKEEDYLNRAFEITINRLRQLKGNNLLVIDNAQQDIGIGRNIDRIALEDNWKVLVTSRQHLEGFDIYELGFLSQAHAIELFYLHYTLEQQDDLVLQILEAIDYHTLAIEVIAKTGQAKQTPLATIIKELTAKGLSLTTNIQLKLNYSHKKRIENIYAFILAAFEIANLTVYEQWILMQFSVMPSLYIHYQNNDGENILAFLQVETGAERDEFTNALNALQTKGWLEWDSQADTFRMHNIIQEMIRTKCSPNLDKCHKLFHFFSRILDNQLRNNYIIGYQFAKFAPYLLSIKKYIQLSKVLKVAYFYSNLAIINKHIGELNKAISFQKKGIEILDIINDSKNKIDFYNTLAIILQDKGLILEALEIQNKIMEFATEAEPDYPILLSNIALTYQDLNQLSEALKYQLKAFYTALNNPNMDNIDFSIICNNLGLIYRDLGKPKEAILYFKKCLEIEEKYYSRSPTLATTYNNIALAHQEYFELDICLNYQLKAIDIQENTLTKYHINLASSYNNISVTYRLLDKLEEALNFAKKSIEIYNLVENNSQDFAYACVSVALIYRKLNKFDEALRYINNAIGVRENILDSNALDLADSYHSKGLILQTMGKIKQAKMFFTKAEYIYLQWEQVGKERFKTVSQEQDYKYWENEDT